MTLAKIVLVGVAIIVLMVVAHDQRWPQRAGVTGACVGIQQPTSNPGGVWYACKQGILTGFPNLEADSCRSAGIVRHREVWNCTAPPVSLPAY